MTVTLEDWYYVTELRDRNSRRLILRYWVTISLGVNFSSLSKILKCDRNDDVMTMKAEDEADSVSFMFENPSK